MVSMKEKPSILRNNIKYNISKLPQGYVSIEPPDGTIPHLAYRLIVPPTFNLIIFIDVPMRT